MKLTPTAAQYANAESTAYTARTKEAGLVAGAVGDDLWEQIQQIGIPVGEFTPPPPTDDLIESEAEQRISLSSGLSKGFGALVDYVKTLRKASNGNLSADNSAALDDIEARLKPMTDILERADRLKKSRPIDVEDDKHWPARP